LPIAKNLAHTVGSEGVQAGTKILQDITEGKDFSEALKEHSKKGFDNLTEKIKQCGKGNKQVKRKPRTKIKTNTEWSYPTNIKFNTIKRPNCKRRKPDQLDIF
jgi:hypothetical protein